MDGITIPALLDAVLPVFPLDGYVDAPLAMMDVVPGDTADPAVERSYREAVDRHRPGGHAIEKVERFAFYERAKGAFAVVMTGDVQKYANLVLKKGLCNL